VKTWKKTKVEYSKIAHRGRSRIRRRENMGPQAPVNSPTGAPQQSEDRTVRVGLRSDGGQY